MKAALLCKASYGIVGTWLSCQRTAGADTIRPPYQRYNLNTGDSMNGGNIFAVTGAGGYLGRAVCEQLLAEGERVRALTHAHSKSAARFTPLPPAAEVVSGSVLEPDSLAPLFAHAEGESVTLIHAAAVVSVDERDERCRRVNVDGTKNVIDACRRYGVKKLLYVSSVDALPSRPEGETVREPLAYDPAPLTGAYARSKAEASRLITEAAKAGLCAELVLPSCILGPGDHGGGFTSVLIRAYLICYPRLSVGGGYDFVDVRDVAAAVAAAARRDSSGESYLLTGRFATMTEVFDLMAARKGKKPVALTLPTGVLSPLVPCSKLICRMMGKRSPLTRVSVKLLRSTPHFCHEKAERELGFRPRPLADTIADTAAFWEAVKSEQKKKRGRHRTAQDESKA